MKLENKDLKDKDIVFICDYRYSDFNNKPIRSVPPSKVLVRSNSNLPKNKSIYYSDTHFIALNKKDEETSKIIAPFDNTGFRSRTGECVKIYSTLEECTTAYNNLVLKAHNEFKKYKKQLLDSLEDKDQEILSKLIN